MVKLNWFKPNTKRKKLIYASCSVLAVFALVLVIGHKPAKPASKKFSAEPVITYSTDKPNESQKDADNYNWRGTDNEPKKIIINKLKINSFVQKAGVDQNKQVAVPNNVHLASWFSESVAPGQLGLSIIDGHVSGWTADGVFKNLSKLVKGDTYLVELGSGKMLNYKVISNVSVKEKDAAAILFSQDPAVKSQLNLITCGGKYDRAAKQFENRIIVSSELQ